MPFPLCESPRHGEDVNLEDLSVTVDDFKQKIERTQTLDEFQAIWDEFSTDPLYDALLDLPTDNRLLASVFEARAQRRKAFEEK